MKNIKQFIKESFNKDKIEHITILPETIKKIKDYFSNYNPEESDFLDKANGDTQIIDIPDAQFLQGDCRIIIHGRVIAKLKNNEFHNAGFKIINIVSSCKPNFDTFEQDDVIIDNPNDILKIKI